MRNLIQQINPQLNGQMIERDYHLVDGDGNVILPILWDAIIKDNMVITMRRKQPVVIAPGM